MRLSVGLGLQMCVLESLKEAFRWRHVSLAEEGKGKPMPHTLSAVIQLAECVQKLAISCIAQVTSYWLLSASQPPVQCRSLPWKAHKARGVPLWRIGPHCRCSGNVPFYTCEDTYGIHWWQPTWAGRDHHLCFPGRMHKTAKILCLLSVRESTAVQS